MIERFEEIPISEESYPFASAEKYLNLSAKGYEEKEFYMYGTSNVYFTEKDKSIGIKNKDVSYVNRIIVREPMDIAKFSGNVVIEIINATSLMEIDRMWILGHRQFLRNGDIYIGITSKHATIPKMKEFNPKRYEKLAWPNPTPEIPFTFTLEDLISAGKLADIDIDSEPGLLWDMLSDLAGVIRENSEKSPICKYNPKYIVLTGWSQSADNMILYMNHFAYKDSEKKDLYDGFLLGAPPRSFVSPVNQYESYDTNPNLENTFVNCCRNPTIVFQTESENGFMLGNKVKRSNGNSSDYLCREYDITGASHDTQYSYVDYYQNDPDLVRIEHLPAYNGLHDVSNDYPLYFLFAAGFRNLFQWIRYGVAPSGNELIVMNSRGENQRDALGIAKGGLRTCLTNYPTGVYYNYSNIKLGANPIFPNSDKDILFGHEKPYPLKMLLEMYGSLEHYRELVTEDTNEQVNKGFIVKEDAGDLIEYAVNLARKRGLK